jgi:hypothetical protein
MTVLARIGHEVDVSRVDVPRRATGPGRSSGQGGKLLRIQCGSPHMRCGHALTAELDVAQDSDIRGPLQATELPNWAVGDHL